jgi:magnesium chelatase family protein
MNPCPCGVGGPHGSCRCSEGDRTRYERRVSGPLLDRFDLRVAISRPDVGALLDRRPGEGSAVVARRVAGARALASERGVRCNADLDLELLDRVAILSPPALRLVEHRLRGGRLTARGLARVRRVGRTLADLDGAAASVLGEQHVAAALELRSDAASLAVAS